jgi:hypothetical protein
MPSILLLLCSLMSVCWQQAESYPMLSQVEEGEERCFSFNIPATTMPTWCLSPSEDDIDDSEEAWYVDQTLKLTRMKSKATGIPNKFPDEMPKKVAKHVNTFVEEAGSNESPITIQVSASVDPMDGAIPVSYKDRQKSHYFMPTVFQHVRKAISLRARNKGPSMESPISYHVCFLNADPETQTQVILDVILLSEDIQDDENSSSAGFQKDKHLTPLEQSLQNSITAANTVLKEMQYMETRESRMRETAESINARVRWFSYLRVKGASHQVTYPNCTFQEKVNVVVFKSSRDESTSQGNQVE